ncbi:Monoterpene epsilon-lactone hydrolase [Phytophthora cinnamomi]|uniref:Monoterpene epsilon-lactone hydrolase n=1 Tax=Phytophthora cinnamomi TaxID=4785 RepID=UPI00355AC08D|nr:Monoterpene epsilon-lactone hydrolase [Phytophthora cinnamomi]
MVSVSISPPTQQLQQTLRVLLGPLLRLWADPDRRRKFLRWVFGGASGVVALLVLEASRGLCRTPLETAQLLAAISWRLCRITAQYVARGFRPKFPKWTLRYELLHGLMRTGAERFGERIVDVQHARVIRRQTAVLGTVLGWFARWQHGLRLESVRLNGLEHIWLRASPNRNSRKRLVVLFFHGGGYAVLSPRMYISFCSALAGAIKQELGSHEIGKDVTVDVFLANYRKLPEHQFPVPAEDAVAMYEYLLQHEKLHSSQIVLAGDSAGGGLVMSTLLRVRDGLSSWKSKLPLPLAAIVACPLADLTGDEDETSGEHCVLSLNMTAASVLSYHPTRDDPSTWADASPVHCDLHGLPPVFLQAASLDTLFQHSLRLHAKAKADGVINWEMDVHDGVPHVFMVIPGYVLPYARVGVQKMAVFAAKQFLDGISMNGEGIVTGADKAEVALESAPSAA